MMLRCDKTRVRNRLYTESFFSRAKRGNCFCIFLKLSGVTEMKKFLWFFKPFLKIP